MFHSRMRKFMNQYFLVVSFTKYIYWICDKVADFIEFSSFMGRQSEIYISHPKPFQFAVATMGYTGMHYKVHVIYR